MATESLTIQITAETSSLASSLDEALTRIQSLQSTAEQAQSSAEGIGGKLSGVSAAVGPLNQVSQALTKISQQAAAIGQQPVTLNVQPALSALQSLQSAIQAVAAQLQALNAPTGGSPTPGPGPSGGSPWTGATPAGSPGLSTPSGVPTSLAASASSMLPPHNLGKAYGSRFAAEPVALGGSPTAVTNALSTIETRFIERDHRNVTLPFWERPSPQAPDETSGKQSSVRKQMWSDSTDQSTSSHSSPVTNHFGGITIEVRETADVNNLMRDLRLQGLSLRQRQG